MSTARNWWLLHSSRKYSVVLWRKRKKIFQKFLLLFSQKEFLIKNISRRLIHRPPLQSSSVYWFCLQSEYFKNFHACFSFRWLTSASKATPLRIRLLQRLAWFQVPSTRNGNCSVATCHNIYVTLKIEECRLMIKVNLLLAEVVVVNAGIKGLDRPQGPKCMKRSNVTAWQLYEDPGSIKWYAKSFFSSGLRW